MRAIVVVLVVLAAGAFAEEPRDVNEWKVRAGAAIEKSVELSNSITRLSEAGKTLKRQIEEGNREGEQKEKEIELDQRTPHDNPSNQTLSQSEKSLGCLNQISKIISETQPLHNYLVKLSIEAKKTTNLPTLNPIAESLSKACESFSTEVNAIKFDQAMLDLSLKSLNLNISSSKPNDSALQDSVTEAKLSLFKFKTNLYKLYKRLKPLDFPEINCAIELGTLLRDIGENLWNVPKWETNRPQTLKDKLKDQNFRGLFEKLGLEACGSASGELLRARELLEIIKKQVQLQYDKLFTPKLEDKDADTRREPAIRTLGRNLNHLKSILSGAFVELEPKIDSVLETYVADQGTLSQDK